MLRDLLLCPVLVVCALLGVPAAAAEPEAEPAHQAAHEHEGVAGKEAEHEHEELDPIDEEQEEEQKAIIIATADLALGWATFEALTPGVTDATYQRTTIFAPSMLLGAEHKFGAFTVGARLPVLMGNLAGAGGQQLVTPVVGNLEVEGGWWKHFAPHWVFEGVLEVAAPTAMGEEAPAEGTALTEEQRLAVLRGHVLRAAEFSRGSGDTTLFEPGRVGIIPKVGFKFISGGFRLEPQVKLETLIATRKDAAEPVVLELVAGVRAAYVFANTVEVGLRVWTNLTLTHSEERDVDVVVAEPSVVLKLGKFKPTLAVVAPLFGRLLTDTAFSVRVGLTAEL